MKVYIDELPEIGDPVTTIFGPGDDGCEYTLMFERRRAWYARSMIANPRTLMKWALRLFWQDFKGFLRGHPKRPTELVREALENDK